MGAAGPWSRWLPTLIRQRTCPGPSSRPKRNASPSQKKAGVPCSDDGVNQNRRREGDSGLGLSVGEGVCGLPMPSHVFHAEATAPAFRRDRSAPGDILGNSMMHGIGASTPALNSIGFPRYGSLPVVTPILRANYFCLSLGQSFPDCPFFPTRNASRFGERLVSHVGNDGVRFGDEPTKALSVLRTSLLSIMTLRRVVKSHDLRGELVWLGSRKWRSMRTNLTRVNRAS